MGLLERRISYGVLACLAATLIFLVGVGVGYGIYLVYSLREKDGSQQTALSTDYNGDTGDNTFYDDPMSDEADRDRIKEFESEWGIPTAPPQVTSEELLEISQRLWDQDLNRIPQNELHLNIQARTNTSTRQDGSPRKLFEHVTSDLYDWSGSYKRFIDLLDNYNPRTRAPEATNPLIRTEMDNFIDVISATDVIRMLRVFLIQKDVVTNVDNFRDRLYELWFSGYSRSPHYNESDSSGFEHIMVGEFKRNRVIGFHNWIQFYREEMAGNLNYHGYMFYRQDQPWMINTQFTWHGKMKKQSSFFIGTSPEYEIAVYSLCAFARPGQECQISVNDLHPTIVTYDLNHIPRFQLATAYIAL